MLNSSIVTSEPLVLVHRRAPVVVQMNQHKGAVYIELSDEFRNRAVTLVLDDTDAADTVISALRQALEDLSTATENEHGWKRSAVTVFQPVTLGADDE